MLLISILHKIILAYACFQQDFQISVPNSISAVLVLLSQKLKRSRCLHVALLSKSQNKDFVDTFL
jgi:hypothetical protein